jgi:CheY-like chemotaxis protein
MDKPKLILLVEDNEICAKLFLTILKNAFGCSVYWLKDGHSALSFLAFGRPDLIQMDIQLPDMSGWETIKIIQSKPELDQIPICVVTASGLVYPSQIGPERQRATEEMHKPIAPTAYVEMIARQLFGINSVEAARIGGALLASGTWSMDSAPLQ